MENKGIEFNMGYRGHVGDFQYDFTGNIGTYRNKVTKLPETIAANGTFGGNGVESVVGHAMYSQVGYVYDGIFKSQEEIDNHATQNGAGLGRIRWRVQKLQNLLHTFTMQEQECLKKQPLMLQVKSFQEEQLSLLRELLVV